MIKILIVEDEVYSRRSLVKQVSGYPKQLEILEAANGRQAWEMFQRYSPEIILSDIKMPFMTGLQLLQKVTEQDENVKVILISGYADFHYAQEALNLGAAGYLLKPVSDEALYDCLNRSLKQSSYQKQLVQKLESLRSSDSLSRFIYDKINLNNKEDDYVNESLFTRILSPYQLAVITFFQCDYPKEDQIQKILEKLVGQALQAEYRIVMMSRCKWVVVARVCNGLDSAFRKICDELLTQGWDSWIGISEQLEEAQSLQPAYEQASSAAACRLLDDSTHIFFYQTVRQQRTLQDYPFEQAERLRCYLEQHNTSRACQLVKKELKKLAANPKASAACCENFVLQVTAIFQKVIADISDKQILTEITLHADSYETMEKLLEAICHAIELVCSAVEASAKDDESGIVERVLAYIDQNYNKDISLKELAENVFFMNHTYLSHLIKKKTGKNYSSYLREVRIHHAKQLLSDPNLSITEVAGFSGYNDSSQFIQVFKKEVGVTPKKYQEMLQNGNN